MLRSHVTFVEESTHIPKTDPAQLQTKFAKTVKKSGHFARCCRSKPGIDSTPHQSRNRGINHVTTCLSHNSDKEFIFALHEVNENIPPIVEGNSTEYISDIQTENVTPIGAWQPQLNSEIVYHTSTLSQFEVLVQLEKQPVRFLIDSGAAVNVLTQETLNKLDHNKSLKISKSTTKILTYVSKQPMLCVLGTVQLLIETHSLCATEDFFAVDTKRQKPVVRKHIPFDLREKVKCELERLEQEDIIEDVTSEPTPWLSPLVVVPKANSESIRLCLDMRKANTAIGRTRYPTPTVEDLLIKLKWCDRFSKLDLNSAFYQLELNPESLSITAFQSEDRIKRFKRLIFGANSASEELQNVFRLILSDINGAMNIADDILIFAKGTKSHDEILLKVFKNLESYGVTLNLQKCLFDKENLDFYGYMFSKAGMQPSTTKVSALKNAKQPETCNDVRSFLGMVNYLKRFIPDFSTLTYPLRQLTKKYTIFSWTEECVESFTKLTSILSEHTCNSFFDNEKETFVYCDASPLGVSSILLQSSTKEHTNANVIAYTSRSLSPTEERYSQIERECLGLVHACERNHIYLFGRQFTVCTDHKALVQLINNPNKALPLRLERMVLKLQKYNFHIKHVRGIDNIADFTSRHPCYTKIIKDNKNEQYVNFITQHAIQTALTLEDIKRETLRDNCLLKLIQIINTGE